MAQIADYDVALGDVGQVGVVDEGVCKLLHTCACEGGNVECTAVLPTVEFKAGGGKVFIAFVDYADNGGRGVACVVSREFVYVVEWLA